MNKETAEKTIQSFKEYCDGYDAAMLEMNGLDHCKNCGMSGDKLRSIFDDLLEAQKVIERERAAEIIDKIDEDDADVNAAFNIALRKPMDQLRGKRNLRKGSIGTPKVALA